MADGTYLSLAREMLVSPAQALVRLTLSTPPEDRPELARLMMAQGSSLLWMAQGSDAVGDELLKMARRHGVEL
jgi:phytoene dehydrogenase-like protein